MAKQKQLTFLQPKSEFSTKRAQLPKQETLETLVPSLGQEDPLEKGMATHFSVLAWRIPWTKEPGRLQSIVLQRADMREATQQAARRCEKVQ